MMRTDDPMRQEMNVTPRWQTSSVLTRRTLLRTVGATAGLATIGGLLAACGGSSSTPTTAAGSTATSSGSGSSGATAAATAAPTVAATSQTTAAATSTAKATAAATTAGGSTAGKGTAIFASAVDIPNIDPAVGHDGATSTTEKHLYDSLYRHMHNPPELVPWLAVSNDASQDAKEWTFKLDPRAKFQDGTPLTADAVVYTMQRLLSINKGVAFMFKGIVSPTGAQAVDDHTVKFTLDKPYAPFLHAMSWLFIVNQNVVKQHETGGDMGKAWLTTNSAGSGPFIIKRWEQGSIFEFAADPNYWRGWDQPHVASYVHQVMHESATERLSLQQNQIQMADWLSVDDINLVKSVQGIVVPEESGLGVYTIKLNIQREPTSDPHVRRAIAYAMDYKALIDVMSGRAVRVQGPLAPTVPGVDKSLTGYDTDLDKAKAELAQSAQYKDGFDIEFTYVTGLEEERKTGLILLDQLAKLNIKVTITPVEWANAVATFADVTKSPLMFPIYSGSDFPDPDAFLWASYQSTSARTWTGASWYQNARRR